MKEKISMIIFVLVLGSALTSILVVVNNYTAPIIEKNRDLKIKKSVLDAFGIPFKKGQIEKKFSENLTVSENGLKKIYFTRDKETAFEFSGSGLWGPITGIISFTPDMKTIKNVVIIHQEETPGLGGRIAEKAFLNKFTGKKFMPGIRIVPPGKAKEENEIDGIAGATMTGRAFEKLINEQVAMYRNVIK